MHTIEHALAVVSERLGLKDLTLNHDGQAELAFADGLKAHVTRISTTVMELSFPLPRLSYAKPSMMRAMLAANFLGQLTGPGRLAIDPLKEDVVYCERWDVSEMDAAGIERRLVAFIGQGTLWLTKGSDQLIVEGEADILGLNSLYGEYTDRDDEGPALVSASPSGTDEAWERPLLIRY